MEPRQDVRLTPGDAGSGVTLSMTDVVGAAGDSVETYRARILVVDDNRAILGFLEDYLRIQGFDVVTATSGREALARLDEGRPDVILLDVRMPSMPGIRTSRRTPSSWLSSSRASASIPPFAVTTSKPWMRRYSSRNPRIAGSSSTTRILAR